MNCHVVNYGAACALGNESPEGSTIREKMLMDLGIAGKVAIVTGGSHGICRAVSEELGRNGCRVVVVARGQEQLDSTVDAIRSEGGEAIAFSDDLTAFDWLTRMWEDEIGGAQ